MAMLMIMQTVRAILIPIGVLILVMSASSGTGREIAFADEAQIVVNGDHAEQEGDDGKDQVAALNGGCEDDELPNEPTGRWQTAEGDHEDEEPCSDEWGALAHTNVFLHGRLVPAGDLDVGGCDEGTDVGKGVGCYVEADGDDAEGVRCCDGEEQITGPGAMEEYASIRLISRCGIATRFPKMMESIARARITSSQESP